MGRLNELIASWSSSYCHQCSGTTAVVKADVWRCRQHMEAKCTHERRVRQHASSQTYMYPSTNGELQAAVVYTRACRDPIVNRVLCSSQSCTAIPTRPKQLSHGAIRRFLSVLWGAGHTTPWSISSPVLLSCFVSLSGKLRPMRHYVYIHERMRQALGRLACLARAKE